ncbi:hypothetical protein VTH06DRAFT_3980 [Thermothelomyces fergusii]
MTSQLPASNCTSNVIAGYSRPLRGPWLGVRSPCFIGEYVSFNLDTDRTATPSFSLVSREHKTNAINSQPPCHTEFRVMKTKKKKKTQTRTK